MPQAACGTHTWRALADSFGAFRSSDGSARRPLKLFQRRECGRLAGRCELLLGQFCLEPLERRAGGEGVGRGQLLVTYREREEHGGALVFGGIFGEARADPAQCKKLEREGLRSVRTFERVAEVLARVGVVTEREGGEADAAERCDQPPAVVDLRERLVAVAPEPQRLGVVTQAERAQARAAERVAGSSGVTDGREQVVRRHVQSKRVAVALLGVGQEAELARGVRAHKRVAQLLREDVRSLERLAGPGEVVHEEPRETEIHQSPTLGERVAGRSRDLDSLLEERHRLREDVPIHRPDAERAQTACNLSLEVPRPQDGYAPEGELLRRRVVPESRADRDPVRRRRQRDGARACGVVGVEAGRAGEPLECLAPFEPAVHPEERVEGFEHRQRRVLVVLGQDPLGRGAEVVQLAPQLVPRDRELRAMSVACRSRSIAA